MNQDVSHGSIEEIISIDARKDDELHSALLKARRRFFLEVMEEYDPGGRRAHEIAKRYQAKI